MSVFGMLVIAGVEMNPERRLRPVVDIIDQADEGAARFNQFAVLIDTR